MDMNSCTTVTANSFMYLFIYFFVHGYIGTLCKFYVADNEVKFGRLRSTKVALFFDVDRCVLKLSVLNSNIHKKMCIGFN